MTTENQAPEGADALRRLAENIEITGPDADGLIWLVLHGRGTTGKAMFNLGGDQRISAQVALLFEQDRRAALAAQRQAAPVALTDIDLCRLISAHEVYQYHPGALHEFADAVIAEFCRVNGIPAPKEPTNDR